MARLAGFMEVTSLGKYLGVPLIGGAPHRADFQYLIEQVTRRLAGWKARHLFIADRITLAKAVLEAILTYPMMAMAIPKSVLQESKTP